MSVDLGDVRTGIAVSDNSESFAFPKQVITEYNCDKLVQKIISLSNSLFAQIIVVGLPKNMDGSLGFRAEKCEKIANLIKTKTDKEVILWDERCTTVSAHTALNFTDTRGKKRKEIVDAVAATIILEDYLTYRKNVVKD